MKKLLKILVDQVTLTNHLLRSIHTELVAKTKPETPAKPPVRASAKPIAKKTAVKKTATSKRVTKK